MRRHKKDYNFIGKSRPFIDAYDKVVGKARYITDVKLPGMLTGKALRSPYPHAKILNIDTSKAKKIPGVRCILTGKEVEQNKWGPITKDQYLLAVNKVRYVGDEVAAVAAVDETACDEALSQIRVEYKPLPAVLDMFNAIKDDAPVIHEDFPNNINSHLEIVRGDVDKVFAEADYVFENEYNTSRAYQAYMEPMGGVSVWNKHGYLTIYAATQAPTTCRSDYAVALNIPVDKIRVMQVLYGGSFGAKISQQVHPLGALIAKYAGQPVRFVLNRQEDFECGLPRVPMYVRLKTAWSKDGDFLAKDVYILCDNGAYAYQAKAVAITAMYRVDALYKIPVVRAKMDLAYTNTVPTSAFRGFGNPQMHFALESQIDDVAKKLGIEPIELRLRNVVTPGYINPHGWKITSCEIDKCIKITAKESNFLEKKKKNYRYNNKSNIKRGIGLAIAMHVSGSSLSLKEFVDGAAVLLRLNKEGRLYIYSNEPDMGQGIRTVSAVSVAEILDMPLEKINVPEVDTDIVPFGLGCWASRGTYMVSSAAKQAAIDLREKLFKVASKMMNKPIKELVIKNDAVVWIRDVTQRLSIKKIAWQYTCDNSGQNMLGQGFFKPEVVCPDKNLYGNISGAYSFGCNIAEVEVNTETGEVKVLDVWSAYDVGQPINPMAVEGQIFGGINQGLGWALMEDMKYGKDGKLLNPTFLDYQIPTTKDTPNIHTVLVDSFEKTSGYGAKGIGELALVPIVPSISNAIYNAIGVRLYELPFSAENILKGLRKKEEGMR